MHSSDQITLAVLPFENLSQKADVNIFCRSFSSDLVTELSKFRQFQVVSYPYRSTSEIQSAKLGDQLGTDYFIQGGFRYDKDPLRINVQLYDSHTRHLVWGNRFEGNLADLSAIQENLLIELVGALQQQINYDLLSRIKKRQKVKFSAYEHWLYGMEELKKGSIESDEAAREHFQKALAIQPDYSLAYSGMSLTYFNEWSCQLWQRWDLSKSGAYEWAQKAIELDDQNYIACMVLGKIFLYEDSYTTAEYYLRRSLQLNPNDPETLNYIAAYFVFLGLHEEAAALYKRSLQLNPMHGSSYLAVGTFIFFELGDFQKAESLIVHSKASHWADAEVYNAANYYYLREYDKMEAHWKLFLETYRKLISRGKEFTTAEAIEWLMKINPHRKRSNLHDFFQFISDGGYKSDESKKTQPSSGRLENLFLKEPAGWKLSFENSSVQLPEVKGFFDIQKMLSQPRQLFHCAELMGNVVNEKGEKLFDAKAKKQYEKKLMELQADIREAEQRNDFSQLEQLQDEYDKLIEYLSQSLGIRGKIRESGNPVEKARSAVTWRIRSAIARIESYHPQLGAHLSNAIKTGSFCSYQPDRELTWLTCQ
jgi:TolB-like protein/Tfp pilus assembly protein PilF